MEKQELDQELKCEDFKRDWINDNLNNAHQLDSEKAAMHSLFAVRKNEQD